MKISKAEFLKISGKAAITQKQNYLKSNGVNLDANVEFIGKLSQVLPSNDVIFDILYVFNKEEKVFKKIEVFKDKSDFLEAIYHKGDNDINYDFQNSKYYVFRCEMNHKREDFNKYAISVKNTKIRSIQDDIKLKKDYIELFHLFF